MKSRSVLLRYIVFTILILISRQAATQYMPGVKLVNVDSGWAGNSVNTVIFRKNSLITAGNTQYIAFYDPKQFLVLGKRRSGDTKWQLKQTAYRGNAADAHNTISIMADAAGYLHVAWDQHGNALNYCKSKRPGSLELTGKLSMTGSREQQVTYPEFYKLSNGDLLFFYRDGASGKGNLVLNRYDSRNKRWTQVHTDLIDGEGQRNAYWQACVDAKGTIHLSWVWRESPDVASNHDLCYARSSDGGNTWFNSAGKQYRLPITAASAEQAGIIPQKSELINQTSMCADASGNPYIATYWRDKGDSIPQYHLVYRKGDRWMIKNTGFRKTAFSLQGAGTKRIPVSRPQVIAYQSHKVLTITIIFRDAERGNRISVASCDDPDNGAWRIYDLSEEAVGSWEPSYDTERWKQSGILNLFIQKTEQADAEGSSAMPPQMIKVLEWKPNK